MADEMADAGMSRSEILIQNQKKEKKILQGNYKTYFIILITLNVNLRVC